MKTALRVPQDTRDLRESQELKERRVRGVIFSLQHLFRPSQDKCVSNSFRVTWHVTIPFSTTFPVSRYRSAPWPAHPESPDDKDPRDLKESRVHPGDPDFPAVMERTGSPEPEVLQVRKEIKEVQVWEYRDPEELPVLQDLLVKGEQEVLDLLVALVTPVVLADLEFQEPWVHPDRPDIATRIPA